MIIGRRAPESYKKMIMDLEEQFNELYSEGRLQEALQVMERASNIAATIFRPDDLISLTVRNNMLLIEKKLEEEKSNQAGTLVVENKGFGLRSVSKGLLLGLLLAVLLAAGLVKPAGDGSGVKPVVAEPPDDILPHYLVQASFYPDQKVIQGKEIVSFIGTGKEVDFNLYLNRFHDPSLNSSEMRTYAYRHGSDDGYIDIKAIDQKGEKLNFQIQGQFLRIFLDPTVFMPGSEVELSITFKAKIPYILDRTGGDSRGVWLGNWLPTISVDSKPIKPTEIGDPFLDRSSTYDVNIDVPKDYSLVLSNVDSVVANGERKVYHARLEQVRDLPLFINHGYHEVSTLDGQTEIHYYFVSQGERAGEVLDTARKALEFYKANVGEYPWKQLNIVENDMYLSGMEYSTMILVSERAVRTNLAPTVFHEVGHQWFYNIIGNNPFNAAYMKEGAVEFFTKYALEGQTPSRSNILSLNRNIGDFSSWGPYREIHYLNGEKLFEDLYVTMGETKFKQFVKDYYDKYKYTIVSPDQFRDYVAQTIGQKAASDLFH